VDVRAYEAGDEEAVVALWDACFPDGRAWNQPRAIIRRKLAVQPDLLLVGTLQARLVATVAVGWDGHRGWLYHLAVAPDCRRRGFGARMVREAESRLRALGCPKVNLQILAGNRDVVAFYERLGYETEDRVSMGKRIA
jgi:ribosomal protein S18 acetylase RimI-like enzyme